PSRILSVPLHDALPICQELMRQHAALDEALQELVRAAGHAEPQPLQQAWTDFEPALLRHLELEEQSLFPLAEGAHAEEVRALRIDRKSTRLNSSHQIIS